MKSLTKLYKKINKFLPLAIFLIAIFLRLYNLPQRTFFDADQEWMAFRSRDLLRGDLALIGPVTSVGSFSIGPGFIYLNSILSLLFGGAPIAGTYLSVFLGILTLLAMYVFAKKFISEQFALLLTFLMSISSTFIAWDQIPWTPSLFYLAQMILMSGCVLITQNKRLGWILLSLSVVVGFQAHIGIVLSILCAVVYFVIVKIKMPDIRTTLISLAILLGGFLPNIVFDIYNDYANLKRLGDIFAGGEYGYLAFSKVTGTMALYSSSILYPRQVNLADSIVIRVVLAAAIANGFALLFEKKTYKLALLLLLMAIIPPALFYIQQGKFSEYYIMMSVPSLVVLTGLLIYKFKDQKLIFTCLIGLSLILNINAWTKLDKKLSLRDKQDVVARIVKIGGSEGYGVSLSTAPGQAFGYNYLFDYYKAKPNIPPLKDQKKIFTIAVPNGFDGINGYEDYGGIGLLWQGI